MTRAVNSWKLYLRMARSENQWWFVVTYRSTYVAEQIWYTLISSYNGHRIPYLLSRGNMQEVYKLILYSRNVICYNCMLITKPLKQNCKWQNKSPLVTKLFESRVVLKTVVRFLPSVERAWLIVPSGGHQSLPWSRTSTSKRNSRRNNGRALNGRCRQQR